MKPGAIILFIIFWILLVAFLIWRNPVTPDLSEEAIQRNTANQPSGGNFSHPLWND